MTKRDALEPKARELYVIHGMTKAEIASRIGVSVRTIHNWSTANTEGKGNWDEQKMDLGNNAEVLHSTLIGIATTLALKIKDELLQGTIDPKKVAQLERVTKSAQKAFDYEKKVPPPAANQSPKDPAALRADTNRRIREKLGLQS